MSRVARASIADRATRAPEPSAEARPLRVAVPAADYWVSAAAVRQAIGAWAYTFGAGERRPGSEAVRAAVAVACAIRELAVDPDRRRWADADAPIAEDLRALADRTGLASRDVELALGLLADARVVVRQTGTAAPTLTLSDGVLAPLPTVAQVDWTGVRQRVQRARGSIAPALAVLRELAALAGAFDLTDGTPVVRASVRDLEDATSFGRSTVGESLAALQRAGVVDVETRAGRTTRFVLRPAAFGLADAAPPPVVPSPAAPLSAAPLPLPDRDVGRAAAGPSQPAAASPAAAAASIALPPAPMGAPGLVGTFAGTPIYAPAGTPLVVAVDDQGRWTCRVGPFLVLGPITPDAP